MKKILITGANSYIGMSFEAYLRQWQDKYTVTTVDMIDGSWRHTSFVGYDTVYHVAGIAHSDSGKITDWNLLYPTNKEIIYESYQNKMIGSFMVYNDISATSDEVTTGTQTTEPVQTSTTTTTVNPQSRRASRQRFYLVEENQEREGKGCPRLQEPEGCHGTI